MPLPWFYLFMIFCSAISAHSAHHTKRWMAVAVWLNIALYYALVELGDLTSATIHLYGRVNILLLALSEIVPFIAEIIIKRVHR